MPLDPIETSTRESEVAGRLASARKAPEPQLRGGTEPLGMPITTPAAFVDYVNQHEVTHIVVFEFSGAVLESLMAKGVRAIAIDRRAPEHSGPSYQGDAWDVLYLIQWTAALFIGPPCFQQLRLDECLPYKISDGRAAWAGAMVVKCICFPHAQLVIVEQPDTICHDFLNVKAMPGVQVIEFRTAWLGDKHDKFIRLTIFNGVAPKLPTPAERPRVELERRPTIAEFKDARR